MDEWRDGRIDEWRNKWMDKWSEGMNGIEKWIRICIMNKGMNELGLDLMQLICKV